MPHSKSDHLPNFFKDKVKMVARKMVRETFQTNIKQKYREARKLLCRLKHITREVNSKHRTTQ